ncbi:MAG: HU family DNA-binding protein [Bacteroidales bacterium]|nr:HU family DNA-binding protein [Bacteroidales bacterium]
MNKTELINAMAEKSGMPKTQVKKALDAMVSATAETLKKGDRIQLFGLGTFSVSERSARTCRNPQNNKTVKVPAKKVVKFKACAQLKEL